MKRFALATSVVAVLLAGCSEQSSDKPANTAAAEKPATAETAAADNTTDNSEASNPFYSDYDTPYGIAPFSKIKTEHFQPALERGIAELKADMESIAINSEAPTFENTVVKAEYAGKLLSKVTRVFFNLTAANTNDELQAIAKDIGPKLSAMSDDITLDPRLFERLSAIYDNRENLDLRADQLKLLEDSYKQMVRGGAKLNADEKERLRGLNKRLTELSIQFGDNLLAETNDFEMVVEDEADLAGLPDGIIAAAAAEASKRGHDGKWVFTAHRPSKTPFLIYSTNRELRDKMWRGYTHRGDNDNANDNKEIAAEMAALRAERAQLMGYKTHADFVLERNTAKNAENVYELLNKVWPAGLAQAKAERAEMQAMIDAEGGDFKLGGGDWRHYSEKIRNAKYSIDEAQTKPYFSLDATLEGMFFTANKLYGLNFEERFDIPKYHEDVRTFVVTEANGDFLGLYLTDFYVRDGKRGGAWMNAYRGQHVNENGEFVKPIVVNVLNYPEPVGDEPTLLTFSQANTLFHEAGHALHGLVSDGIYPSQAGTSVPRDFVEFPSQVMENWMMEPEVLKNFARHYKTGEVIPQELIEKIQAASRHGQGFATTEYMAAALLDLAWHTQESTEPRDADAFEKEVLDELGLIDEIAPRYRTTYFAHIFSGGYSAGYYSYIWSEILDADAYQAFKENGIFDQETADKFRTYILSKGGSADPMELYRQFRGKDADPKYLLERRGFDTDE